MMRRDDGQTLAAVETRFGRLLIAETAGAVLVKLAAMMPPSEKTAPAASTI